MGFGDKDPITLGPLLCLFALGGLFALICVWIGPALAVVLGIWTIGTLPVLVRHLWPRWIKAFWAWCIDVGKNKRVPP